MKRCMVSLAAWLSAAVSFAGTFEWTGAANDVAWRVPTGESIYPAMHLPALQDGDDLKALRTTNWELSGRGALRVTCGNVAIDTLSVTADGDRNVPYVFPEGHKLRVRKLYVNGTKLPGGVYTSENRPDLVQGEGALDVRAGGFTMIVR